MSFTTATRHIPTSTSSTNSQDSFARGIKSLFSQPEAHPLQSWIEISPYGFVSRNYINYIAGKLDNCSVTKLPDGSMVVNFSDGTMIVQSVSGHVVELDRLRRVVLVRVTRSEATGARLTLGRDELSPCFQATTTEDGQSVMVMPGNIVIVERQDQVSITLPNGTELFAKRIAATGKI